MARPAVVTLADVEGFSALDDWLLASRTGVAIVEATESMHEALLAHSIRRLVATGRRATKARAGLGAPLFREVATLIGIRHLSSEPALAAEQIAEHLAGGAIAAALPARGTWDDAVASELARDGRCLVVYVASGGAFPDWEAARFQVGATLDADERGRWFGALADHASAVAPRVDMASLELWWSGRVPGRPSVAGSNATRLTAALSLCGRSVPVSLLENAGFSAKEALELATQPSEPSEATEARGDSQAVDRVVAPLSPVSYVTDDDRRVAARLCLETAQADQCLWGYMRAAELFAAVGEFREADAAIAAAYERTNDASTSGEVEERWVSALTDVVGEAGLNLRLQAAARALTAGEADEAKRWCERARDLGVTDARVPQHMGRALHQLGDLVAAKVSLNRALRAAPDDDFRASIYADLAEVAFATGDLDDAKEQATRAVEMATALATRLDGRNVLGKIYLTGAQFDVAEEHFTADGLAAAEGGDRTRELRARTNRGIVLYSRRQLGEAKEIFESVRDDGERYGEPRAVVYALYNLATIAFCRREYGAALEACETVARQAIGLCGRTRFALNLTTLAELRLRVGLVDHAENTVAFARRLIATKHGATTLAHLGIVSARIALARERPDAARREIDAAIATATRAGDVWDRMPEAYLVSARIALHEGDAGGALRSIRQAEEIATSDDVRAEATILRAQCDRASGDMKGALELAVSALGLARLADRLDLLAETHGLVATAALATGDVRLAREHCSRAIEMRDEVVLNLPSDIRAAFLARPDMIALSRLWSAQAHEAAVDEPPPSVSSSSSIVERMIVGGDARMRALSVAIAKVATCDATVLIRGESGTGKELVAEALHRASVRRKGPLVTVNCAALVETLLLSELFGHEKGSFTGASSRRRGRFELAEGGTLFLDEIGDISARTQVALLRVLQEKTFERVGGTSPIRANVRVVCATHRDLRAMVSRGEFREDLYYRLCGMTLEVPALREHLSDLPALSDHLLGRVAAERGESPKSLSVDAIALLQRHSWPGNVRELENVLRACSIFADGPVIHDRHIIENFEDFRRAMPLGITRRTAPPPPEHQAADAAPDAPHSSPHCEASTPPSASVDPTDAVYSHVRGGLSSLSEIKRQLERECIVRALGETRGNITRAAALLGLKRPRLSQLVKELQLVTGSEEAS